MKPSIIVEQDSSLPIAQCTVAFNAGSLLDPPGKEGATSLLFRLLRRSIPGLSATEVEQRLDALGGAAGADASRSMVALQGMCLSRSWQSFSEILLLMLGTFPRDEHEFRRLKAEACDEWVDSLDNDSLIARRGHPYGRLTSGTPASIECIELADLRTLYDQLLTQDRLITSFSGDVSLELATKFTTELRAQLPAQASMEELNVFFDPTVAPGRRLFFVDKPERSQVQILIGCLGSHPKDHDRTALYVGNTIFGGTFSARLSHEVRGKRGWSYGAHSQLAQDRMRQSFSMWTFPQAGDAAGCITLQLRLFEEFIDGGITKRELAAAKKYLLNSHAFALDTASKRSTLALDQQIYDLPPIESFKDRVSAVTVDEVAQALRNRLSVKDLVLVVLGTASEHLTQIEAAIGGLSETCVLPFDLRD
jgi:zinc protease